VPPSESERAPEAVGSASAARGSSARRILLKLSGEVLGGRDGSGLDPVGLETVCAQIARAHGAGAQVAVVMGGGNLLRGAHAGHLFERTTGDAIGMLGTLINALAVADGLRQRGLATEVLSAFPAPRMAELYRPECGRTALTAGRILLLAGGTGNGYFTTDSAAALRALELGCDLLVKGTKVDGVYTADPVRDTRARRYRRISLAAAVAQRLGVMDLTAATLCMENHLPVVVLKATEAGTIARFLQGETLGTLMDPDTDAPVEFAGAPPAPGGEG